MMGAPKLRTAARGLIANQSGVSIIEFALSLPLILGAATYGIEAANMTYCSQIMGDIAVMSADSTARVRTAISEGDITEILTAAKTLGTGINFAAHGRIIVSGLEPVYQAGSTTIITDQKIGWQRCSGALTQNSSYGVATDLLGTAGMGPTGRKIAAAAGTDVIVVEVRYQYQPIISAALYGPKTMTAIAAITVRERPNNAVGGTGTASPCNVYAA